MAMMMMCVVERRKVHKLLPLRKDGDERAHYNGVVGT
jgi:hypothetical protein